MELPEALAPWVPYLDLFPREALLALGPLVQRLDRLVGPLRVSSRMGGGDPDGFDGIGRRGSYERLIVSEWLLAEEAPLEFLRRAAMGEHAFLQLARREPAGARLSAALFDAGPDQLGAPRLAHLAALIVLARRAEIAGIRFAWGVAQQIQGPPQTGVTEANILQLLDGRSAIPVAEEHLQSWRSQLGAGDDVEDLWLIGGPRMARLPSRRGLSLLEVADVFEPGVRRICVAVSGPTRGRTELVLDLPEPRACVRLLRDPFQILGAEPRRVSQRYTPASNLLFTVSGTKLLARSTGNDIIAYPIPNSPYAGAGKPKLYAAGAPALAAGRIGKATVAVTVAPEANALRLECLGGKCTWVHEGNFFNATALNGALELPLTQPVPSPLSPCCAASPGARQEEGQILALIHGALIRLRPVNPPPTGFVGAALMEATDVVAMAIVGPDRRIAYVGKEQEQWVVGSLDWNGERNTLRLKTDEGDGQRAFFGYGGGIQHPVYGLVAVERKLGQWHVVYAGGQTLLARPEGARVVGVVGFAGKGRQPSLVVLQSDGRTLAVIGPDWNVELPRASAEIAHVTVSQAAPDIAYVTVRGELVVYSLNYKAALYRLETEAAV